MANRVRCVVPFCTHTRAADKLPPTHNEWICGNHWRLVGAVTKRRLRLFRMRARRYPHLDYDDILGRLWVKAKAQAIECAVGITA